MRKIRNLDAEALIEWMNNTAQGIISKNCSEAKLIAIRPYSANPKDEYLSVVLCEKPKMKGGNEVTEYVTWCMNWQSRGLCYGHYTEDPDKALEDFCKRKL